MSDACNDADRDAYHVDGAGCWSARHEQWPPRREWHNAETATVLMQVGKTDDQAAETGAAFEVHGLFVESIGGTAKPHLAPKLGGLSRMGAGGCALSSRKNAGTPWLAWASW